MPDGVMSHAQFAAHANTEGASRNLFSQREVGHTSGYAVSVPGSERRFDNASMSPANAAAHRGVLMRDPRAQERPEDAMHGAWKGDDGHAYSDLSFPYRDRRVAASAMHAGSQRAMYDYGHQREVFATPQPKQMAGDHTLGFDMIAPMKTPYASD